MKSRCLLVAVVVGVRISTGIAVNAAPVVTVKETFVGGYWSLDYRAFDVYYSASPGTEFTNYRLTIQTTDGTARIQDPVQSATSDQDADAVDTFANTVYSLFGFGPASYTFMSYKPIGGIGSAISPAPTALLDWSVFDVGTGDTNSFDAGPPYGVVSAPWHLARVLLDPDASFDYQIQAFDSASRGVPTVFDGYGGAFFSFNRPAGSRSTITAVPGESLTHLFKAFGVDGATNYLVWSNFTFDGPGVAVAPTYDNNSHLLTWDTSGSIAGTYIANVRVQYPGGWDDLATVTIHLIPEPATSVLVVAAVFGGQVLRRRRM